MNKNVYFNDSLHYKSMRGMWRYSNQLKDHFIEENFKIDELPEVLKKSNNKVYNIICHEIIEPFLQYFKSTQNIINPFNIAPNFYPKNKKVITVIHDLIFLDNNYRNFGAMYRRLRIKETIKNTKTIVVVSNYVKELLESKFKNLPPIIYIPNQLNPVFETIQSKRSFKIKATIFHLGGLSQNKGTDILLQSFSKFLNIEKNAELRIGSLKKSEDKVIEILNNYNIPNENVVILPYLNDKELAQEYANADIHCMPSFDEGFGIPIIEAASQKTINVLSPIPIFKEILGNNAIYFEDWTSESIVVALKKAYYSKHTEMVESAYENAMKFKFNEIHKLYFQQLIKSL